MPILSSFQDIHSREEMWDPVDTLCTQKWSTSKPQLHYFSPHQTQLRYQVQLLLQQPSHPLDNSSLATLEDQLTNLQRETARRCLLTWKNAMKPQPQVDLTQRNHALSTLTDSREWPASSESLKVLMRRNLLHWMLALCANGSFTVHPHSRKLSFSNTTRLHYLKH